MVNRVEFEQGGSINLYPMDPGSATSLIAVDTSSGFLCLPSQRSHWIQGRVLSGGATSLALIAVDQLESHHCLTPADGSFLLVDVALMDLEGGREALICGVERTGGSLCALNAGAEAAALSFLPRTCFSDEAGVCLAKTLFPDVIPLSTDAIVVEGEFHIDTRALAWRTPEEAVRLGGPSVASLLARRWPEGHEESGESASGADASASGIGGGCAAQDAPSPGISASAEPQALASSCGSDWIDTRASAPARRPY